MKNDGQRSGLKALLLICGVVLLVVIGTLTHRRAAASYDAASAVAASTPVEVSPIPKPAKAISVTAEEMLKQYAEDAASADTKYKHTKTLITGPVTQVLFPSPESAMRLAQKGADASPIITLDSAPIPLSQPGEGLFTPGIAAHSKAGSFFGLSDDESNVPRTGEEITLSCTGAEYVRISEMTGRPPSMFGDINLSLNDCTLVIPH